MNREGQSPLIEPLTEREQDVLELLVQGKTNREIAEELVLSVNTVKWYNRQIYGKLGVGNREAAAERARELGLVGGDEPEERPNYHLPHPATSLLGRERELEELESLLLDDKTRIISLIGPGGMGKTRLALEVAQQLNYRFNDGAAFVPLAPLQNEESIVPAIAQSLRFTFQGGGQDEKTQLINFLRGKELLLVLDNFEHLIGSAPLLVDMIEAAPNLKLVVTSREKLKLQIEQLYPLQSLPLMDWETVSQAEKDPALRLFLEYGRRVRPNFELQSEDLEALHQILQLVDGMPLAIILASAWLELLTPVEIAAEIQKNIDFLEAGYQDLPGRQRSMSVVFDTSWNRLNEAEQRVFSALSIFRGGFTLDAARKVADATPDNLLGLASRSLLNRDEDGRFDIHELLRQFAAETLARSPTYEAEVRDKHSGYYLNFLETSESELKGANSENTIELIKTDIDNIYEGWNRAVKEERFQQLGSATFSLTYFTNRTGRYKQTLNVFAHATTHINKFLSMKAEPDKAIIAVHINILAYMCELQAMSGDPNQAVAFGNQALSLLNKSDPNSDDFRFEKALSLSRLGRVYYWLDRYDKAGKLVEEGLKLFEEIEDNWQVARSHLDLSVVCIRSADIEGTIHQLRKALPIFEALGGRYWIGRVKMFLGLGLRGLGKGEEGKQLLGQSIKIFQDIGEYDFTAIALHILAEIEINGGDFMEGQALATRGEMENRSLGRNMAVMVSRDKWSWATLHLGDYDEVLGQVQSILEYARDNDSKMRLGRGHSLNGDVWLAKQNLEKAIEQLKAGTVVLREIGASDYLCFTLGSLCCAYIKTGNISEAKNVVPEAFDFALSQKTTLFLAAILPSLALLKARQGMEEKAVELYALASREPYVANSQWYEDVFGRSIDEATASLPLEVVKAAKERGRGLDLWETAERLFQEFSAA